MEEFKIDLFKDEYERDFPNYVHLSETDCSKLAMKLSKRYEIPVTSLVERLSSIQSYLENVNAKDDFELRDILGHISIKPLSKIYINWYKFGDIDLFDTDDLNRYFDNIWFPSADDIDLFDESLDWIVSIRHDGVVSFIKKN